ncbi:MAG: TIGR01777 family oxidoreductase [Ardenticatenia bacterium]|nr:TIGR01777 family oxidoreductase [Ardenticatenia bacterium]
MRVLITGGTGLLGRALSASLAAQGHEVIVLSRSPAQHAGRMPGGVRLRAWDAHSAKGWTDVADGAGAIVNLAGENIAAGRWTPERKRRIRESRLNAGRAVVEAVSLATQKPKVVVQASAVGFYGPAGNEELTEEAPPGHDFLAQVCVAWEASTAPVEQEGVRRVILRTGIVLSTDGGALPRMMPPFKLGLGGPLGNGQQWLPWIHIRDHVRAVRFLIEHEESHGPYNLSAPTPVRNVEFTRALGRVLGRPTFMRVPAIGLRLLFGEMATVLLGGQRAVPRRLLEAGFTFEFTQVEAALRDLLT